jgi:hypothetical protein
MIRPGVEVVRILSANCFAQMRLVAARAVASLTPGRVASRAVRVLDA